MKSTELLSDATILNCLDQMLQSSRNPVDFALGNNLVALFPTRGSVREQLSAWLTPKYPKLLADRLSK